jgi:hypothetical protein
MRTRRTLNAAGRLLAFCLVFCVPALLAAADPKDLLKQLETIFKKEVQKRVTSLVTTELIRFDRGSGTLAFSPIFLQGVGMLLEHQSDFFKTFRVEPSGDRLGLNATTVGGTHIHLNVVPQSLELDLQSMTLQGLIPGGLQVTQAESAKNTLSAFFDTVLGVAPKVSQMLQSVAIEGDTFRLTRPLKTTALPRLLKLYPQVGSALKQTVSVSMQDGWLSLQFGQFAAEDRLMQLGIEMLLLRIKGALKLPGELGSDHAPMPADPFPETVPTSEAPAPAPQAPPSAGPATNPDLYRTPADL